MLPKGCGCTALGCLGLGIIIGAVLIWLGYEHLAARDLTPERVAEEAEWLAQDAEDLTDRGRALPPGSDPAVPENTDQK